MSLPYSNTVRYFSCGFFAFWAHQYPNISCVELKPAVPLSVTPCDKEKTNSLWPKQAGAGRLSVPAHSLGKEPQISWIKFQNWGLCLDSVVTWQALKKEVLLLLHRIKHPAKYQLLGSSEPLWALQPGAAPGRSSFFSVSLQSSIWSLKQVISQSSFEEQVFFKQEKALLHVGSCISHFYSPSRPAFVFTSIKAGHRPCECCIYLVFSLW